MIDWDGLRDTFSNLFASEGFKSVAGGLASGAGAAGTAALGNYLFPGTPAGFEAIDSRTSNARSAEDLRLGGARGASTALQQARQGKLNPRLDYNVRRSVRNADAARGMLETGGSGVRETNAVQDELNRVIQREAGNLNTGTTGYTPMAVKDRPASKSPWADLFTGILAPSVGTAIDRGFKSKWSVPQETRGTTSNTSLSDELRSRDKGNF